MIWKSQGEHPMTNLTWKYTKDLTDQEISPYDWLNIANCARERSAQAWCKADAGAQWSGEFKTVRAACGKAAG